MHQCIIRKMYYFDQSKQVQGKEALINVILTTSSCAEPFVIVQSQVSLHPKFATRELPI